MIYSKVKSFGLRAIEESDLPTIHKWRNSECLRHYFREYRELSMIQIKDWYRKMIPDNRFEMFVIEKFDANEIIGVAGITHIDWVNRHADLHFYIGQDDKWIDDTYSKNAMKILLDYGFNTLNLNKLWTEVYEVDKKKLHFYNSLGFTLDGSLREHYFYKGRYYTSHMLSLLVKDYD
tara:strand:+ start:613 stop:1143 length:531 start_codon:yes stop_codon:yes gene_type:complete